VVAETAVWSGILNCPLCAAPGGHEFLRRYRVPVHQNLMISDERAARSAPRGDIVLRTCIRCGFICNSAFHSEVLAYDRGYENTQACSPFFAAYLDGLVHHLLTEKGVRDCRIVEIGCGNGHFIRALVSAQGSANVGLGFDPAYRGPEVLLDGRLRFVSQAFDAAAVRNPADVAICRHVIEHVPDPVLFLRSVRTALGGSAPGRLFLETPDAAWILRNRVFWDFFYEHCSYFTAESLASALELAGFSVLHVRRTFGEQYLWVEASVAEDAVVPARNEAACLVEACRAYAREEPRLIRAWLHHLDGLSAGSGVALWGAGAKGVTLANLLDADRTRIRCVVDLNPNKQGCYVPGTGHPIVGYRALPEYGVRSAVLLNPNYAQENRTLLEVEGLDIALVESMEPGGAT
jgi:2-polyprenyl-3-methyl-5-hydroxy-6-metoxy-1,4-benzoquinol methylase